MARRNPNLSQVPSSEQMHATAPNSKPARARIPLISTLLCPVWQRPQTAGGGKWAACSIPYQFAVARFPIPRPFLPQPTSLTSVFSCLPDHLPALFDRSAENADNSPADSSHKCLHHLGQTGTQGQGALRRRALPSSPSYLVVLSSDECAAPTLGAELLLLNPNPDARSSLSPSRHPRSPRRPGRRQCHEPDRTPDSECILQLAHIGRVRCGVEEPVSPLRAYSGAIRPGSVCYGGD